MISLLLELIRLDLFDEEINSIPSVKSMHLEATYLAWVDFSAIGQEENVIMKKLVADAKIIANPGSSFGLGGSRFVRFNLANSREIIKEATNRIKSVFKT